MFQKMFCKFFVVVLAFIGLINCSGGGGDPKPPPPPPPVTYTVTLSTSSGVTANPTSASGSAGDTKVFSITLASGYTNPVATPASAGTFSNGVVAGTYNFTVVLTGNMTINISATPPVPVYSISGHVVRGYGAIVTLSTGQSVTTDGDGNYVFTGVPTGNYIINISLFGWTFDPSFRNVGVNNADSTGNDFTAILVNTTVEMSMGVFFRDKSGSNTTTCAVAAQSLVPKALGTTRYISTSVQKPGDSFFTHLLSGTIGPDVAGYSTITLYSGDGFYDTMPDGTKKYWLSGVAIFKLVSITENGETTSTIAKVGVGMGYAIFGPLQQAIVSPDGKSIQLVGSFPTAPIVKLHKFMPYPTTVYWTLVPNNFVVTVPPGFSSTDSQLVATSGFPDAESTTVFVNIPPPQ